MNPRSSHPRANAITSVLAKALAMELLGRWVKNPYETIARRAALVMLAALSSEHLLRIFSSAPPVARAQAVQAINLAIDTLEHTDALERRLIALLDELRGKLVAS